MGLELVHRDMNKYLTTPGITMLLMLGSIIFIGIVVRVAHLVFIDVNTPIHAASGGLFLEFAGQIASNNFWLPKTIPYYTDHGIPFAYPPLAFYLEAILVYGLKIPEFTVVNVLPPTIATLTLPSFYFLTASIGFHRRTRLVALLVYSIIPVAFAEPIQAAGLAEALGSLTLIWLFIALVHANKKHNIVSFGLAGIAWAFCIGSSPGSAYGSTLIVLGFSIFRLAGSQQKNRIETIYGLLIMVVIAILGTSPYLMTVLVNHGIDVFWSPFLAPHRTLVGPIYEIILRFERFEIVRWHVVWDLIIVLGIFFELSRRAWLIPMWFCLVLVIPREGVWLVAVPASLLAGIGVSEVVLPALKTLSTKSLPRFERMAVDGIAILILVTFGVGATARVIIDEVRDTDSISVGFENALKWGNSNLEEDVNMITLMSDEDWSPYLLRRTVLNMPFGAEWQPEESREIKLFNDESANCEDLKCVGLFAHEIFGYDDSYFIMTEQRYAELDLDRKGVGGCQRDWVVYCQDGIVIGTFDQ